MIEDIDEEVDEKEDASGDYSKDEALPVLSDDRHLEKIEKYQCESHSWRLKDRVCTMYINYIYLLLVFIFTRYRMNRW